MKTGQWKPQKKILKYIIRYALNIAQKAHKVLRDWDILQYILLQSA
jgi:hypothetical protein